MGKYHSGVHIPKGVKVANAGSKLTPRQSKFAHGLVRAVKNLEGTK